MLEDAGCIRLLENETWALEKGKRYFTTRNGSSVLAFSVPENYNGMQIVSAHSDSPTFRVKSGAEITVEGHYKKLNTEGYGGMILSTWFDRPLSLAGRAVLHRYVLARTRSVGNALRNAPLVVSGKWMTKQDFARSWKPWLRGTAIGFPMGTLPGGGSDAV